MQTSQFSFKKCIGLLALGAAVFLFLPISSCKAPKGACIALTKSKINKAWGKPGYLKDIDYLTFITSYNPIKHEISVGVQAFKKDYTSIGSFVKLSTGDGWKDTLPSLSVGRNNIGLD